MLTGDQDGSSKGLTRIEPEKHETQKKSLHHHWYPREASHSSKEIRTPAGLWLGGAEEGPATSHSSTRRQTMSFLVWVSTPRDYANFLVIGGNQFLIESKRQTRGWTYSKYKVHTQPKGLCAAIYFTLFATSSTRFIFNNAAPSSSVLHVS